MAKFKIGEQALFLCKPELARDVTKGYLGTLVTITSLFPEWEHYRFKYDVPKNSVWYRVVAPDKYEFCADEIALHKPPPMTDNDSQEYHFKTKKEELWPSRSWV